MAKRKKVLSKRCKCRGTGRIYRKLSNGEYDPCPCPLGDQAIFAVDGQGFQTGKEIKKSLAVSQ